MINAIIIDDEELGRTLLGNILNKYCKNVNIVGQASSAKDGFELINNVSPDLVFLDIEMPGGSGFDLLEKITDKNLGIIFTTAYNQYAVKAFKFNAIDYLLKPINIEELIASVNKVTDKKSTTNFKSSIKNLIENYNSPNSKTNKIALPTQDGLEFVEIKDIIRCEADGKYTFCFLSSGKRLHSTRGLKDFEEQLSSYNFCRIHHAHLVNLDHIKNYFKGEGGYILMSNGDNVTVSKRKKEVFLKQLNKI